CTSPKSQVGANVISDNQGGVWVLWYQKIPHNFNVPDSNRHGLQHLDSNGYPTLPQNGIILNDSLETFRIVGLYATSDGSLTVCYMGRTSPSTTKAYIQRFRQDGSRVWGYDGKPITGIAGDTAFLRAVPTSILPLADGGAYISLIYTYGSPQKGYIQRMSADGAYLWGDTGKVIYEYNRADPLSGLLFKRDEGGAFFASAHTAYLYMYLNGIDSSGNLLYPVPGTMVNNPRAEMNNFAITSRRDDPDSSGLMHFKVHTTVATTSGFKDELRLYICNGEGDLVHSDTGIVLSDTTTAYINANTLLPQNDGSIIYTYQASTTDRTPWYARRVGPSGGDLWETPVQLAGADSMIIGAVITQDTTGIIATWD
ncbi:MAG TPA: hypothetical protein VJ508_14400, partial [Saprospiraceae bacterium]|nr:hypothetical protein [Saprospiraceae bacterium]